MASTRKQDIYLNKGASSTWTATIKNLDGSVYDITSSTVVFLAQEKVGGIQRIIYTNAPGGHLVPAAGTTQFTFVAADTDLASIHVEEEWPFSVHVKDVNTDDLALVGIVYVKAEPWSDIA